MQERQHIRLIDVPARLHLGVPDEERAAPQTVLVSLTATLLDPPRFEADARLDQTIDYSQIIVFIRETLDARGPWVLIESIAEATADFVFTLSARIAEVEVSVKKPSVLGEAGMVSVTIMRAAPDVRRRLSLADNAR